MTLDQIKSAIEKLPKSERRKLADWLEKIEDQEWDAELQRYISPGGPDDFNSDAFGQDIDKNRQ